MSSTLISALVFSVVVHVVLVVFGPPIRPPHIEELKDDSVEVELIRKEVQIPDALLPKPIPVIPQPEPLDLKRLLIGHGDAIAKAKPKISADRKIAEAGKIPKTSLISGLPRLRMPNPVSPLDALALHKGAPPAPPDEIALPLGRLGLGKGLARGKYSLPGRGSGDLRSFTDQVSRLAGGDSGRRSSIRGPAAARRVVYRPPAPRVRILNSSGDIELRFWVLPDGTVGRVVPIRKGNARLEGVAANHLRRWRFTPLRLGEPPREEWGVMVYRFRVR